SISRIGDPATHSRYSSITVGLYVQTTGTTRCSISLQRDIALGPMIAADMAVQARSAMDMTWITTLLTSPRSSTTSACATPFTSAIQPEAVRQLDTSPATAAAVQAGWC